MYIKICACARAQNKIFTYTDSPVKGEQK